MMNRENRLYPEADLPSSMIEIKEVIGLRGAVILLNRCGGTRLFVPRRLRVQHKLVVWLGMEAAQKMCAYFGGETLSIVRASKALKTVRNREIIARYGQGEKASSLALGFGLTERQIYTILSGSR